MNVIHVYQKPEFIPELATWINREWGHFSAYHTVSNEIMRLRRHSRLLRFPFTLVGQSGEAPVGMVSVMSHDEEGSIAHVAWLSCVLVPPQFRHMGFGSSLVRTAEREAMRLGVKKMLLFTTNREAFFARLGWRTMQKTNYGQSVALMAKELRAPLRPQEFDMDHNTLAYFSDRPSIPML